MKHLVVQPLPDELVSSVFMRTCRHAGLPIGVVTRALTGRQKWHPRFFQTSHVSVLADATGTSARTLLMSHSTIPYASSFYHHRDAARCVEHAILGGKYAQSQAAITQAVSDYCPFRRYCPRCAAADLRRWGESYWHRAHNLPGVNVCLTHMISLHETAVATTDAAWNGSLPGESVGRRVINGKPSTFDLELVKQSVSRLVGSSSTSNDRDGAGLMHYRHALIRKGLLSSDRQIDSEALVRWGAKVIGRSSALTALDKQDQGLAWMTLMVRPNTGAPSIAFKHLLFSAALAVASSCDRPLLDHIPSGPSGAPPDALDTMYARLVRRVVDIAARSGERIRVCDALKEAGCWSAYRHNRTKFPRVGRVVQALRQSPTSVRRVK